MESGVREIRPSALSTPDAYRLITGVVVPRPIAWVTSMNASGSVNLAPFSCFTFVSYQPILVGISIGPRGAGRKDTATNIIREREFVVNIAHESEAALVHASSAPLPPEMSEVEHLELHTQASTLVRTPRLAAAPVALECRFDQLIEFGEGGSEFFVARVELVHVRENLLRDGKIATEELRPLTRIAGPNYSRVETVQRFSGSFQRFLDRSPRGGRGASGA